MDVLQELELHFELLDFGVENGNSSPKTLMFASTSLFAGVTVGPEYMYLQ